MVRKVAHLNKLRFLAVFFVLLIGAAILQVVPMSAMARSTVTEADLVNITGQSGALVGSDVTVNDVTGVVAWGDSGGYRMRELADAELAKIYGAGFAEFTLNTTTGIALMNFPGLTISTFTEINSMKMGYYNDGTGYDWDNNWIGQGTDNVLLGTANTDLLFKGLYIEAQFTNTTNNNTRQLEYLHIGTPDLTGPVSANFVRFSGEITGAANSPFTRFDLGNATITANNSSFYLSVDRLSGFRFHWGAGTTKTP